MMCFSLVSNLQSCQFFFKGPHAPALTRVQGFKGSPLVVEWTDISHFHGAALRQILDPAQGETLRAANIRALIVNPALP